jgi:hypothetical protein
MAVKILKFWHQWNWAIHCSVWIVMGTAIWVTSQNTLAANTKDIATIFGQNLNERIAVQEQTTKDISERLGRMEDVQSKIFDRVNTIADRQANAR